MKKLNISNIKVSVKLFVHPSYLNLFKNNNKISKENGSFFIYRNKSLVYSIYYKGHVNITGIKTKCDIANALTFLSDIPGVKKLYNFKVDNITCSAKLHQSIYSWNQSFTSYLNQLNHLNIFNIIQYSPQIFPGAFLKSSNTGTIIFFASGKFNVVGCKNIPSILTLIHKFTFGVSNICRNGHMP